MRALLAFPLLAHLLPAASLAAPAPLALILTDARDAAELRARVRPLEEQGARIRVFLPPDTAFGEVPEALDGAALSLLPGEIAVLRDPADPRADGARLGGVWRELQRERPQGLGSALVTDALMPSAKEQAPERSTMTGCAGVGWTSAYMLGDVSIAILLTESVSGDPAENSEDWDTAREDQVVAEIVEGASQIAGAYPDAGLDFFLTVERRIPVSIEPIGHESGARGTWISDSLEYLGQSSLWDYLGFLRGRDRSDWAVAAFVVDSLNDADGMFVDTPRFAFAYLGGPYQVMTFDNDGWGIGKMDTVFSHELGHNFDALDEYASAGVACDRRSGILAVENQNSAVGGCLGSDRCLMRTNSWPDAYCSWSAGQLGLRDSDADGIPDLRSEPPQSHIDPVDPDPIAVADLRLTGSATALPDASEATWLSAHTLNELSAVDYRLDGGAWSAAVPSDGAFDQGCEDFHIDLAGLAEGWHEIETRATVTACDASDPDICTPARTIAETSYPKDRFYVNTDCAEDVHEENDRAGQEVAIPAGVVEPLMLCAYDADRFRVFLRTGATLSASVEYANPAARLSFTLLAPSGDSLASTTGAGGVATVTLAAALETGWHALVTSATDDDETAYRLVVTASCIDDRMEPSDVADSAPGLAPGPTADLQLCRGNQDWYRVSLSEGADLAVDLDHTAALGNLDLHLFAPDMTPLGSSATGADRETVALTALTQGVYHVLATGATTSDENRYGLGLSTDRCLDDLLENDDSETSAAAAAPRMLRRLCPGDEDWTALTLAGVSRLGATLGWSAPGELDLELRDSDGIVIGRSAGVPGFERLELERLPAGNYLLRVSAPAAIDTDYVLTLATADPVLLLAVERGPDVVLDWSDAQVECYALRRSTRKESWAGAFETVVDLAAGSGELGHDATSWADVAVVPDGSLYFYDVAPVACAGSLLSATKTATPYPIYDPSSLVGPPVFSIVARNEGRENASSVTIRDDMTPSVSSFSVLEIPPGSTDNSSPTGGAFGRGYVQVDGIALAPGDSARVRFIASTSVGTPNAAGPLRNAARVTGLSASGHFLDVASDDPSTHAAFDSTDVLASNKFFDMAVTAFWNQDVNVDLRVVDPCGNAIGSVDLPSAQCPTGMPGGSATADGGCGDTWHSGWWEAVRWTGTIPVVAPGRYEVWLRYTDSALDAPLRCRHGGLEDVVVLLEVNRTVSHRWVVLDPTASDWVKVTEYVVP